MFFILQREKNEHESVELFVLHEILKQQKFLHQYVFMKCSDLETKRDDLKFKEAVPVGSIEFVQEFLRVFHEIHHMHPIEIPNVLRHDRFLKRKYSIVEKKDLPREGYYFTKSVSKLKDFTHVGLAENLKREKLSEKESVEEGLYQVSEVVEILSEYRCFIQQDEILGIQFYNGDPLVLPNEEDLELLKEMVIRYTVDKTRPLAYTFDVAILKDRGLALIECHPHTSVGLYGCYGNFLPYSYKFGFEWYIKHNTPIKTYSNFESYKKDKE